ncbi:MAG: MBL fold metallo-hydrolase [Prochlorococcus sp. SP3034]|nr:MBL fold metallo-hydrolase [Prochlorococcus sp. SP3034]|tara:strand:+ start:1329 stop:2066 length:738 start_codon:yes stop_codon:yes gene_type:complete
MNILKIRKFLFFYLLTFFIPTNVLAENLIIRSFGHSSFLIKGGGQKVLLNPFKSIGCAEGLEEIKNVEYDFILASSRLADEGYNPNNQLMFVDSGTYKVKNTILSGIKVSHDRFDGRRFGMATVWIWDQNNFKIVHMGGAAGSIDITDQIILSRPDLLFISIGGGPKSYDGREASEIVKKLKPKIIVPVHFLKDKDKDKDKNKNCNFSDKRLFLKNIKGYELNYVNKKLELNPKKIQKNSIYIFN